MPTHSYNNSVIRMTGVCRGTETVVTHLEEKLDSLDWSYSCFGDGSGDATCQEVLGEGNGLFTHLQVLSAAVQLLGWWG